MKNQIIAFITFITFLLPQYGFCQTNVSGNLSENTTWNKEGSPYNVIGNIGVPSGINLTVEPGVTVNFEGNYEILIFGMIDILGSKADSIYFKGGSSAGSGTKKMLEFRKTNLSLSSINYASFSGPQDVLLVSRETESEQDNPKVSGSLVFNRCKFTNSIIQTDGYNSDGKLVIQNSIFDNMLVKGRYPRSEPIKLNNCQIFNSNLYSDSYNKGITVSNSTVKFSEFTIGCCGANFNIKSSKLFECDFIAENDYHVINISNSIISNTSFTENYRSWYDNQELNIDQSVILMKHSSNIDYQDLTISNTFIKGNRVPIGIESRDNLTFTSNSIVGCQTALVFEGDGSISNSNFISNSIPVQINGNKDVNAPSNYWNLNSGQTLDDIIIDQNDDLNLGNLKYEPIAEMIVQNGVILPPETVYLSQTSEYVNVNWTSSENFGYKIYYDKLDEFEYLNSIDIGATDNYSIPIGSSEIVVTAYDLNSVNVSQLTGTESWFSEEAKPYFSAKEISQTNICKGDKIEVEVISYYNFDESNEFILQLSDVEGSFEETLNLDNISNASEILSSLLPDTLQSESTYLIRVFSSELNLSSESFEITPRSVPIAAFELEASICSSETSTITYTGDGGTDATYGWDFDGASVISGTGQGPYELSWATEGTKSISLEVSKNGCTSFSENQIQIKKTPTADFSVQTQLCEGESALISYTVNTNGTATFTWDFDEGTIISGDGSGPFKVAWDSFGMKTISLSVEEDGCSSDQKVQEINYNQYPSMSFEANESTCYNEDYSITFTGSNYTDLNWSFDGANIISGSGAGPYILSWNSSGTKFISLNASNNGCTRDTTLLVEIPEKPYNPDICLVTVDEASSKNMLIWEYDLESVSQFGIYRETNVSGEYSLVEFIEGDISNTYIDNQSSPSQQSNRYKVTSLDSCGTETELSNYHKTIHLTINKGIGNTWNLIWDGYEGFSFGTYRIYRNLNNSDFELLTDIASNLTSFSDTDVTTTDVAYQIEVVSPNSCGVSESGRLLQTTTSRSNIARNTTALGRTSINDQIEIFPNPTSDYLNIESSSDRLESYELKTLTGQVIQEGELTGKDIVSLKGIPIGVYLLSVSTTEGRINKRIVKK